MNNFFYSLKWVHFVGVGGVSMSKLCAYTLKLGIKCTGSDSKNSNIKIGRASCRERVSS